MINPQIDWLLICQSLAKTAIRSVPKVGIDFFFLIAYLFLHSRSACFAVQRGSLFDL